MKEYNICAICKTLIRDKRKTKHQKSTHRAHSNDCSLIMQKSNSDKYPVVVHW